MEDLDLALSGLEKIHKVVNDVSPLKRIPLKGTLVGSPYPPERRLYE